MTKYEFCFSIEPKTGRSWPEKRTAEHFEIELTEDQLFLRSDHTAMSDDALKATAQEIAASLADTLAFLEKQPVSATLGRMIKASPGQPTAIGLFASDKMEMKDSVQYTVEASHGFDAYVVLDSRLVQADEAILLSGRARRSISLKRMLDWMAEFNADPDKKLAPLYNIVELIEKEFGGLKAAELKLGISAKRMQDIMKISNNHNDPIFTGRHPGANPKQLRPISPEELAKCVTTPEAIIRNYAEKIVG